MSHHTPFRQGIRAQLLNVHQSARDAVPHLLALLRGVLVVLILAAYARAATDIDLLRCRCFDHPLGPDVATTFGRDQDEDYGYYDRYDRSCPLLPVHR